MARLPIPGADPGTWGDILNDFLQVSLNPDGTVRSDTIGAPQVRSGSLTGTNIQDNSLSPVKLNAVDTPNNGEVPAYNGSRFEWVQVEAHSLELDAIAALSPSDGDVLRREAGAWSASSPTTLPISTATQDALDQKPSSTTVDTIVTLTQAAYDALSPKVATTLYIIIP